MSYYRRGPVVTEAKVNNIGPTLALRVRIRRYEIECMLQNLRRLNKTYLQIILWQRFPPGVIEHL